MARSFEEPLEPEGLICFKFCTKSHIQSSWLLWPGRVRGEAPLRRGQGCAKKGYDGGMVGEFPPFLHADSELAGVSPAVSAQS